MTEATTTTQFTYTDGHNKTVTRAINHTLNIDDYLGLAGYPLLFMAANTHLSLWELYFFLHLESKTTPGTERSRSWLQRRRWMFLKATACFILGDKDGNDAQAKTLLSEHPTMSLRGLVRLLQDRGITRSKEWVRQNRVTAATNLPVSELSRHSDV